MSNPVSNAFIGHKETPTAADLENALGATKFLWDSLIAEMVDQVGVNTQEWRSYSPKAGWALRLKRAKRTVLWMAPCERDFQVTFILGEKAVRAARETKLSAKLQKIIDEAPKYPEGTGIRLQIKRPADLAAVRKLARIKLDN